MSSASINRRCHNKEISGGMWFLGELILSKYPNVQVSRQTHFRRMDWNDPRSREARNEHSSRDCVAKGWEVILLVTKGTNEK